MKELYPLLFTPVYKHYLWGGNRLATRYGRENTPSPCAESWEIADRPEGMSVAANGPYKGKTLHELIATLGTALLGNDETSDTFPLLIKLIDARKDLSVQVHPNNANARLTGGEPKTEMWIVLEAEPEAIIYAGLKPGISRESFEKALGQNTLAKDALAAIPARPGRAVFVPGGRVHAIGAGCMLLEIQQNSDTTYRVFDWNRTDDQGNARELHLDQAMQVIDWNHATPEVVSPRPLRNDSPNEHAPIMDCPFFNTARITLLEPETIELNGESFHILFVVNGKVLIGAGGHVAVVDKGTSCLIPAGAASYTLTPVGGRASVIRISR